MRSTALAVLAMSVTAAYASEPGQPLDCSDWVFLEPGLGCVDILPHPCTDPNGTTLHWCLLGGGGYESDNTGGEVSARVVPSGVQINCSGFVMEAKQLEIRRLGQLGDDSLLAYLRERCFSPGLPNIDGFGVGPATTMPLTFDRGNGVFRVGALVECLNSNCPYPRGWRLMGISGFATTFDVLQTFTPSANAVGFRVPYMPEGMAAADHFDTYYGPLTHPIDFASAQSLACDYPAAAPAVGEYLEVADPLPDPAPGTGRYYITSVTHQGQTRYGRKTSGGRLSGRDPAQLPACAR